MAEEKTNDQLQELAEVVVQLSPEVQASLYPSLERLSSTLNHREKLLGLIKLALNDLRLDVNYLIFDLEATRRERDEYKQQLDK